MIDFTLTLGKHVAEGFEKLVFQHPTIPGFLIKIMIPDERNRRLSSPGSRTVTKRFGPYYSWQRENEEFDSVVMRRGQVPEFLQAFHGLCVTNLGLGMIVTKVTDSTGNLAPCLASSVLSGQISARRSHQLIDDLGEELIESKAIAWDLQTKNLLVTGPPDIERLVLIDGLGDRTLIPLRKMYDWPNKRDLTQKIARLHNWVTRHSEPETHSSLHLTIPLMTK